MAKDSVGVKQSIISRVLATLIFCIFLVSVGTTFLFGRQRYQNVRTAALADVKLDLFHSQRMIAENLNLARQSAQRLLEHWPDWRLNLMRIQRRIIRRFLWLIRAYARTDHWRLRRAGRCRYYIPLRPLRKILSSICPE